MHRLSIRFFLYLISSELEMSSWLKEYYVTWDRGWKLGPVDTHIHLPIDCSILDCPCWHVLQVLADWTILFNFWLLELIPSTVSFSVCDCPSNHLFSLPSKFSFQFNLMSSSKLSLAPSVHEQFSKPWLHMSQVI